MSGDWRRLCPSGARARRNSRRPGHPLQSRHSRSRVLRSAVLVLALASGALACVPALGGWDIAALEARHPVLARWSGHRLGDMTPYFAPVEDGLLLFLCRWNTQHPIPLSLPADATDAERVALWAALTAWQSAGLGLRFSEVPPARAQFVIRFVGEDAEDRRPGSSATTSADCALPWAFVSPVLGQPLAAEMVRAELILNRSNLDVLGRPSPLALEELAGTLLHELGHALGYPSHAGGASSVMTQSVDQVRRLGRQLLAGGAGEFRAPTLAALYAVPSGTVVGRTAMTEQGRAAIARLSQKARELGWVGPFARVGDRTALLWWQDDAGAIAGFMVPGIDRGWPADARWIPTRAARTHLAR